MLYLGGTINQKGEAIGFFASTGSSAKIHNLILKDFTVSNYGYDGGEGHAGILVRCELSEVFLRLFVLVQQQLEK